MGRIERQKTGRCYLGSGVNIPLSIQLALCGPFGGRMQRTVEAKLLLGTAAMVLILKSIHESPFLDRSLAAPQLFRKCIHCSVSCLREAGPQVCGCQSSWMRWFSQAAGKSSFFLLEPLTSAALNTPVEPILCHVYVIIY